MRLTLAALTAVWGSSIASAQLVLPSVLGDHMVLQRGIEVPVWGWGKPNCAVSVELVDGTGAVRASANGEAGPDGRFSLLLPKLEASAAPATLRIVAGNARVERTDVLVGEVWLCGGQSNMAWPVSASQEADAIVATLPSTVRCFTAPHELAAKPVPIVPASWEVAGLNTTGSFTAVGSFFARAVGAELGVPIGLLSINWGGSPAEAWVPTDAAGTGLFAEVVATQRAAGEAFEGRSPAQRQRDYELALAKYQEAIDAYWTAFKANEAGFAEGWLTEPCDESHGWSAGSLPIIVGSTPETQPLDGFDGASWWRRRVPVPPSWAGKAARVVLGAIDDSDALFVNGVEVGRTIQLHQAPRIYRIPEGVLKAGENEFALLIIDTGGPGGLSIEPRKMVMRLDDEQEVEKSLRAPIALAGSWMWKRGSEQGGRVGPLPPSGESHPQAQFGSFGAMWNGMMAPVAPYAIRGAIWYQGEANADRGKEYETLLPLLIASWRERWRSESFPFGIVQLAAFQAASDDPVEGTWARLRKAQLDTALTTPNCGIVVTTDVGDANDIHPRNKRAVGERLASWALATVYGREREWSGPLYQSASQEGASMAITFTHATGLAAKGGGPLGGFAIAGADGIFHWADARVDGERVVVSSPNVPSPREVRYGWSCNPVRANLVNAAGLPASPFATD
jgi:sialate O-acetylesterase